MKHKLRKIAGYWPLYLMMLPGFLYVVINNYIPMAGIVIAFKRYNALQGIWKSPFCGFKNFEFLFRTSDAWLITRNTIEEKIRELQQAKSGLADIVLSGGENSGNIMSMTSEEILELLK